MSVPRDHLLVFLIPLSYSWCEYSFFSPFLYWMDTLVNWFFSKQCCSEHQSAWIIMHVTSSERDPFLEVGLLGPREKSMAPHSSTLAWKIPWTEGPGRLQSMGLLRVGHDSVTSLSLFTFMHWRRKWQPTPVFLSGESQGRGSLVSCHLWGCTKSDMTEAI